MDSPRKHDKIKLVEINSYLTCYLCKGYLIDATTISECLHSFCRSCIIKFLQENCYCPVCEVIINKAKPCLKLDKTLQDIVYKLVPELFVKEMYRRKVFYQSRPALWLKVSPEERGEDTERTIFNPQDAISLSIEYISDDSSPGAIPSLPLQQMKKNTTITTTTTASSGSAADAAAAATATEPQDNPMKRYLQCPGMCRIDVLKKFVRNKYNVDTNLFHIDILYKRVPLPDHYTLIDIGYIYSWKRNEPMKFFFRITDINKVTERFDYFDGRISPEIAVPQQHHSKPSGRIKNNNNKEKNNKQQTVVNGENKKNNKETTSQLMITTTTTTNNNNNGKEVKEEKEKKTSSPPTSPSSGVKKETEKKNKEENEEDVDEKQQQKKKKVMSVDDGTTTTTVSEVKRDDNSDKPAKVTEQVTKKDEVIKNISDNNKKTLVDSSVNLKPEITEEIKNKIQSDCKNSVYTNITLNRDDNVEIITKIQKVSNKEGHPIGLNIINHTMKKTNKVQSSNNNNNSGNKNQRVNNNNKPSTTSTTTTTTTVPSNSNEEKKTSITDKKIEETNATTTTTTTTTTKKTEEESKDKEKEDLEKSNFLKSIELTAKNPIHQNKESPVKNSSTPTSVTNSIITTPKSTPSSSSSAKRKNSSPVKNDKTAVYHHHQQVEKKTKVENNNNNNNNKKPVKIIIQPKSIQNPAVRQMVTNVNQNVNNMSKIVEQSSPSTKTTDLKSLIDNCKIPASLSITLNDKGDGGMRTPPSIPPVKNYIEILKLPDSNNGGGRNEEKSLKKEEKNYNSSGAETKASVVTSTTTPSTPTPLVAKNRTNNVPTFQKIFEEAISKKPLGFFNPTHNNNNNNTNNNGALMSKKKSSDLTESGGGSGNKRKILEIASQLQKKTKLSAGEHQKNVAEASSGENKTTTTTTTSSSPPLPSSGIGKKEEVATLPGKIAIPRLAPHHQRTLKSSPNASSKYGDQSVRPQTSASLHSSTLGMNYTVSVSSNNNNNNSSGGGDAKNSSEQAAKKPSLSNSKPSPTAAAPASSNNKKNNLSPNQLLEKYNIQNLAQLTAGFSNFNNSAGTAAGAGGFNNAAGLNTALQHAMLLKQLEHHHQTWLNQGPLLQYEKYLQTLSATHQTSKIMGNIKEN